MSTLYNLSDQYVDAMRSLEGADLPPEVIADTLEGLEGELTEKVKNVAMWRENQLLVSVAKKELAKKLIAEAKSIEDKANKTIDYIDTNLRKAGIKEVFCDFFTVKYAKNPPSLVVDDEAAVSNEFIKTKEVTSIDKAGLKKAIQEGLDCDYAHIEQKERLVIK